MTGPVTVAVTGLNATDNPGPGVAVVRAIRRHPDFRGRVVGLAYDSLEPGLYAAGLLDDAFLLPYPSQGVRALSERLRHVKDRVGLDVVIPTLDSELPSFIALEPELEELGVGTFLPTRAQLELRSKAHLADLGREAGLPVPAARVLADAGELYAIERELPYPLVVKGLFYGASVARSIDEAVQAYHRVAAQWGLPVLVQAFVPGDEYDVLAVGDGEGGLVGAIPMRKTFLTSLGKGWAGVAVRDPELIGLARRFVEHTRWRGPCEVEVIRDPEGGPHILEVNPRFPAWCYLSAGAGMNLPWAVLRLALGERVEPLEAYEVGTMFVRIALDQIAHVRDLERIAQTGEMVFGEGSS